MWCTLLPWKSMVRRPAVSSIQMPSALAMALRHGVETDWRRKYFSSSASSVCASGPRFFSAQARRCGDRLVSLSDSLGVVAIRGNQGTERRSTLAQNAMRAATSPLSPGLQTGEQYAIEHDLQQLRAERRGLDHRRHPGCRRG